MQTPGIHPSLLSHTPAFSMAISSYSPDIQELRCPLLLLHMLNLTTCLLFAALGVSSLYILAL